MLEEMFPNTKKIELFARNKRDGWESFGNEISA
jgi:N6-adenosine-specific RNA methylase IME4